jgi:hypothetical protein
VYKFAQDVFENRRMSLVQHPLRDTDRLCSHLPAIEAEVDLTDSATESGATSVFMY